MVRRLSAFLACMIALAGIATAQANGKLQIHHIDVGQGDGAVLISPNGQVVVFDAGEDMKKRDCTKPVSYLDQLGIKHIDYLFVSPALVNEVVKGKSQIYRGEDWNEASDHRPVFTSILPVNRPHKAFADSAAVDR